MKFRGRPLIEYAIAAARPWDPVVVAGAEVGKYLNGRSDATLLLNDAPELGMSHSLALAHRFLPADLALIVLLGDKPLLDRALVETICAAAAGADIAYPIRGDEPGHPVFLSPNARSHIDALPAGDTLRLLRAQPDLRQRAVETNDRAAFFDVDTIDELFE
jgi:CTP:molybdopterin cytidylyltransferase MocA